MPFATGGGSLLLILVWWLAVSAAAGPDIFTPKSRLIARGGGRSDSRSTAAQDGTLIARSTEGDRDAPQDPPEQLQSPRPRIRLRIGSQRSRSVDPGEHINGQPRRPGHPPQSQQQPTQQPPQPRPPQDQPQQHDPQSSHHRPQLEPPHEQERHAPTITAATGAFLGQAQTPQSQSQQAQQYVSQGFRRGQRRRQRPERLVEEESPDTPPQRRRAPFRGDGVTGSSRSTQTEERRFMHPSEPSPGSVRQSGPPLEGLPLGLSGWPAGTMQARPSRPPAGGVMHPTQGSPHLATVSGPLSTAYAFPP